MIAAAKVSSQGDFIIFLNNNLVPSTGKSLSEAPIFASTNLQYDDTDRLLKWLSLLLRWLELLLLMGPYLHGNNRL